MKHFIHSSLLALCLAFPALADDKAANPPKLFETPVEASDAFIKAAKAGDAKVLLEIFGDKHKEQLGTDDPERDKELRAKVAAMAIERRRFRDNDGNSVSMVIGAEAWPFPIPIVKTDKGWHFDTDTGIAEIIKRRVGENELTAIDFMRAYQDAQRHYASSPKDDTKVRHFARKFQSAPGAQDGLPLPANVETKGSELSHAGYHFKILTAQGEAAPGGKYDYTINGNLIGGFALIAWPADYRKTGVMTFIVNQYGDVYERDLGPDTAKIAATITEYDPSNEWLVVSE